MAYDPLLADRIRCYFDDQGYSFDDKNMMGGLCFMVDGKMACGTHIDKTSDQSLLMARIGADACDLALENPNVLPMNFTGRPMKGYIFVEELGLRSDAQLHHWLKQCLDFNPLAKASKKRK